MERVVGRDPERWLAAGAALDSKDAQVFVRDLVSRLRPGPQGTAGIDSATLSPGEQQIDPGVHERLVETLDDRSIALRSAAPVTEA